MKNANEEAPYERCCFITKENPCMRIYTSIISHCKTSLILSKHIFYYSWIIVAWLIYASYFYKKQSFFVSVPLPSIDVSITQVMFQPCTNSQTPHLRLMPPWASVPPLGDGFFYLSRYTSHVSSWEVWNLCSYCSVIANCFMKE